MTTTYDPTDPAYLDEASVRNELTRVFGLCHGCGRCLDFCPAFPTLFDMIDRFDDHDAGRLTPAQQDVVVDRCFQCKRCSVICPYTPDQHEWQLDFPRLVLRATAMRHETGQQPVRRRWTTQVLGRTELVGPAAVSAAPIANRVVGAPPGSTIRKALATVTGVSSVRLLPPFARERFSTWFRRHSRELPARRRGEVTVFPTCHVEYHATQIGKDLVRVYERNGIDCSITAAGCCGAPWLHAGDVARFNRVAERNVSQLAEEVRHTGHIVVPQPECGDVLQHDYVHHVAPAARPDAELVAAHTFDVAEFLMRIHEADDTELDVVFDGDVPEHVTHHAACRPRARNGGSASCDLMKLTGCEVTTVRQCSGSGGTWGLRAENEAIWAPIAAQLGDRIVESGQVAAGHALTGDCSLANAAIAEQTGAQPSHPIQLIARAYGIPVDG